MFRILAYSPYLGLDACSDSCLFMHIQVYPTIFNNDSYNNIQIIFFILILHTFQQNLKRHMFFNFNDVNFNARLSLLK